MSQHRAPSIQDVAAAAGVSTATVSRVLNSPALVSQETAERVRQAIQKLGYRPNLFAQGLMTRKSRVLGIALPDIHGEFYSELLRGADEEAHKLRYHLLVGTEARQGDPPENGDASGFAHAFGLLDGLAVMITEPNDRLWKEAATSSLPVVVLDADVDNPGVDCVLVDNAVGTREAVEHLLASVQPGHLYFVGGPSENYDTRRRAETFQEVVRATGVTLRPDQLAFGQYAVEWGYAWAMEKNRSGGEKGGLVNAGVLAANDEIALGILQAAQDAGVGVPSQLKIVGFDDTRVASLVRPALSSVRVPLAEVGAAAIDTLVRRVDDPGRPATKTRLATKLVVRESSGWERGQAG
ncbi:MAG: LacI family DNA-binding transcriptional regulator [Phycisphaerales bacterium]